MLFFLYDRRLTLHQQSVSIMVCFNKSDSQKPCSSEFGNLFLSRIPNNE